MQEEIKYIVFDLTNGSSINCITKEGAECYSRAAKALGGNPYVINLVDENRIPNSGVLNYLPSIVL